MNKIVFATNNKHKLFEIREILSADFDVVGLTDIGFYDDIPETGDTLAENAWIKSNTIYEKFGIDCFSDDTGLEVEALDGRPGVYSARYAGENCSFEDNVNKLLGELEDCENRNAAFVTVISLMLEGVEYQFEGRVDGKIIKEKHGAKGFGYDPVFMPNGYNITFAEMDASTKNKISHRGKATKKLVDFLQKKLKSE